MNLQSSSVFLVLLTLANARFEPNWPSLDKRTIPPWFDNAKIGIFLHWGVFSVPSVHSEWFWEDWQIKSSPEINKYLQRNFPPRFTYQEFARDFTAEFFNASQWAQIFRKSGAKYVVLTSKHHEGYTLWPSKYSFSWNAMDIGPHRDLVGELGKAVRDEQLKFGLYHSLYEWFNPMYISDKKNGFQTQEFVDKKIFPELVELVERYKPSVIWSDGDWEANDTYWRSTEFLAWLYNDSPVKDEVLVNDRWGIDIPCNHGDFINCKDRYDPGTLQKKKWENAMTLDKHSWGFRRNAQLSDFFTSKELLSLLAKTISCGGNLLINVGPSKEGVINPIFEERLLELGTWLGTNGEAIYGTQPWTVQNDTAAGEIWYTSKGLSVYAIVLGWPTNNTVQLQSASSLFQDAETAVQLLGHQGKLKWTLAGKKVEVHLPDKADVTNQEAYVLKIIK